MNLFELLALLLIFGGLVYGIWFADGGWLDLLWSGLGGAARGFGIYLLIMVLVLLSLRLWLWYQPPFPRCRSGRCGFFEIDHVALVRPGQPWPQLPGLPPGELARCRCGTLYLRPPEGGVVLEVRADGSLLPWMRHGPLGRWRRC